jgi:hypothetical protein
MISAHRPTGASSLHQRENFARRNWIQPEAIPLNLNPA